jgi:hypothetical protein
MVIDVTKCAGPLLGVAASLLGIRPNAGTAIITKPK